MGMEGMRIGVNGNENCMETRGWDVYDLTI